MTNPKHKRRVSDRKLFQLGDEVTICSNLYPEINGMTGIVMDYREGTKGDVFYDKEAGVNLRVSERFTYKLDTYRVSETTKGARIHWFTQNQLTMNYKPATEGFEQMLERLSSEEGE